MRIYTVVEEEFDQKLCMYWSIEAYGTDFKGEDYPIACQKVKSFNHTRLLRFKKENIRGLSRKLGNHKRKYIFHGFTCMLPLPIDSYVVRIIKFNNPWSDKCVNYTHFTFWLWILRREWFSWLKIILIRKMNACKNVSRIIIKFFNYLLKFWIFYTTCY